MNDLFPPNVFIMALIFFLAGSVKGVTGMGLPTVAMGTLGVFMSPLNAASLLVIPSFVTNAWQLGTGPSLPSLIKRLWIMMLGIVIGTLAGASLLTRANAPWAGVGLGSALLLYALHGLWARPLAVPAGMEHWLSPVIGLTTGVITGGTGVFVIPAVPYLQALGLSKDELIQALGLSFTISTLALSAGLLHGGALHAANIELSTLAIIPALLGMRLGTAVRRHISGASFRRGFLILLAILGLEILMRAFF